MGTLADALNFERSFTVCGITFTARRLSLSEILRCAVEGVKATKETSDEEALELAESLICGEDVSFPKAGIEQLIVMASDDLDAEDAEALSTVDYDKTRKLCRFILGLNEEDPPEEDKPKTHKKKVARWTGWHWMQKCVSTSGSRLAT